MIANNVLPSAEDEIKRDADIPALLAYLDKNHVRLKELGCYVALSRIGKRSLFAQ